MNEQGYNGWTNWATWNANLWLTNDPMSYRQARCAYSDKSLCAVFSELFGNGHDGIDVDDVNWGEIFDAINE